MIALFHFEAIIPYSKQNKYVYGSQNALFNLILQSVPVEFNHYLVI